MGAALCSSCVGFALARSSSNSRWQNRLALPSSQVFNLTVKPSFQRCALVLGIPTLLFCIWYGKYKFVLKKTKKEIRLLVKSGVQD